MNELKIFENQEFGKIRIVDVGGKPYAIGNDVAKALKYAVPKDAISAHCKGAVSYRLPTNGGHQEMKVIPEGDIYRLIVKAADQSRNPKIKEKAERFESWIFDDVLPTIRKTGAYMTPETIEKVLSDPDTIIALATKIKTLQADVKILRDENSYNYSLIQGLNRKLSLAEMRQILNRVVRKVPKYSERWSELYKQFDMKYHMNVRVRARARNVSTLDYIEKDLQMLPELFDIACKLYESEVDSLVNEIYNLRAV